MINEIAPNIWVHMLTVSVWILNTDWKQALIEGSGGRCPFSMKSLSLSQLGSAWWGIAFHPVSHTYLANCSTCSAQFLGGSCKSYGNFSRPSFSSLEIWEKEAVHDFFGPYQKNNRLTVGKTESSWSSTLGTGFLCFKASSTFVWSVFRSVTLKAIQSILKYPRSPFVCLNQMDASMKHSCEHFALISNRSDKREAIESTA